MEFCLHYSGVLKSNDQASGKHKIRKQLHPQIENLCRKRFYGTFKPDLENSRNDKSPPMYSMIGEKRFYFLISKELYTVVNLDITLLLPHPVGSIVHSGGDIDNRIKTLFDALRIPQNLSEAPSHIDTVDTEHSMFCLLEDDKLINRISIKSYEDYAPDAKDIVKCFIQVETKVTQASWEGLNFV